MTSALFRRCFFAWLCIVFSIPVSAQCSAATASAAIKKPELVLMDSDIGDDIDDAFAVSLALRSPELKVLGISVGFGETSLRARLLQRMLREMGCADIPVAMGRKTKQPGHLSQERYALHALDNTTSLPAAADFLLQKIHEHPGQITLIAVGPMVNIGDAIDKDPATFKQLKRIVIMGGSINRRPGDFAYLPARGPVPEWNIRQAIPAAKKLFASGVPIYMMPMDATQLKLDEVERKVVFQSDTPLTTLLATLYYQWGQTTPTLYDAIAVGYAINPEVCPTTPMRISVDEKGNTIPEPGTPNAYVCLRSNSDKFFDLFIPRLIAKP